MNFSKLDVLELTPARHRIRERNLWQIDLASPSLLLDMIPTIRLKLCGQYIALFTMRSVRVLNWRSDESRIIQMVSHRFLRIFTINV